MDSIKTFIYKKCSWEFLRLIGEIKILKLTIISPFLPFLFLFLNKISLLNDKIPFLNSLNFGWPSASLWQITVLYYGLILLGSASILYCAFCPYQVRLHKDHFSYMKSESQTMTVSMKWLIMNDIQKKFTGKLSETEKDALSSTSENIEIFDLLKIYFSLLSYSKENIRLYVSLLYFAGFILVFMPSIHRFMVVTWILVKSICPMIK